MWLIGKNGLSKAALGSVLALGALATACSSNDGSPAATAATPFDSGAVAVPEAGASTQPFITVQVQGQGQVGSGDATEGDGGLEGQVACSPNGAAAECSARQNTVLYALPAPGWVLTGWSTTGLAAGIDLANGASDYQVTDETPSPLIITFSPQSDGAAPPASSEAVDAGGRD